MLDLALLLGGFLIGSALRYFRLGREAEVRWDRLANRKSLAILICAGAAMVPRLALLPWLPPPIPMTHDEFSYVLGAQTLAAGRLTNPTPPFWQHFESYHINMVPTYQSMYPPAPSLFLALGIVTAGNPWWGVWLGNGLMCAVICWALQPLIRPRYALIAGIFCAFKYGIFTLYSDSFWGGSVAALGGALTLGAFVRLISGGRLRYVFGLVTGVALLANSRPFEGFLFTVPIALACLLWTIRRRNWRVLIAVSSLLAIVFAAMGYYNLRGTGSALKMPYLANFEQYHFVGPFLGMKLMPRPAYRHPQMAAFYDQWEGVPGRLVQTASGILALTMEKIRIYYKEPFAPLLLLAILGLIASLRTPSRRILAATFLLQGCGLFSLGFWPLNFYTAPLLVSFFGLAMLGVRYLRVISGRKWKMGPWWARGLIAALLLFGIGRMGDNVLKGLKAANANPRPWNVERVRVIEKLSRIGGEHLVFMNYSPAHNGHEEWVYNSPDIDRQKVIFARSMGEAEDRRLMQHYAERKVWTLDPDAGYPPTPKRMEMPER